MLQIQCLKSTCNKPTELYSKYSIGPFIKGQSITIGNTLRRVLLSNLQGLAITGVHIKGTAHEFSSVPNVKEDVIDILLNLKQIILKGNITEPVLARINTKEAGIIIASDIAFPNNITVVDPNQYIMSLTNKESLEMELLIAKGQSYLISEKLKCTIPRNFLAIDAVFMPVSKVNFFVQPSSNNSLPDFESLILEIWTNGSIMPDDALSSAAEILESTFGLLTVTGISLNATQDSSTLSPKENHVNLETIFIDELELSGRAYNALKRANVNTLSDLIQYSANDLLQLKNFGQKSAEEVNQKLKALFNLKLIH